MTFTPMGAASAAEVTDELGAALAEVGWEPDASFGTPADLWWKEIDGNHGKALISPTADGGAELLVEVFAT